MKKKDHGKTKDTLGTRTQLLTVAKKIFSRRGYEGTGVREIAEISGVNVAAISYYFAGKEGLFKACVENFGKTNTAAAERVLKKPNSAEEFRTRLEVFITEFLELHLREREVCLILRREMLSSSIAHDIFEDSFLPLVMTLEQFFRHAQNRKIIRAGLDPLFLTTSLISAMAQMTLFSENNFKTSEANKKFVTAPGIEKMVSQFVALWCDGTVVR